tara:strand:+ start:6018 stop:6269 length:252 start_codon:yes stop_codon:yes gene_type:complete
LHIINGHKPRDEPHAYEGSRGIGCSAFIHHYELKCCVDCLTIQNIVIADSYHFDYSAIVVMYLADYWVGHKPHPTHLIDKRFH